MSDTIYYNHIDKNGMHSLYEHPINPKTQAEADAIYRDLDGYMCEESIFQDGEASLTEAIQTFTFYLQKAKRVKALGFLPRSWPETDYAHDVFSTDYVPTSWADYRNGSR